MLETLKHLARQSVIFGDERGVQSTDLYFMFLESSVNHGSLMLPSPHLSYKGRK